MKYILTGLLLWAAYTAVLSSSLHDAIAAQVDRVESIMTDLDKGFCPIR